MSPSTEDNDLSEYSDRAERLDYTNLDNVLKFALDSKTDGLTGEELKHLMRRAWGKTHSGMLPPEVLESVDRIFGANQFNTGNNTGNSSPQIICLTNEQGRDVIDYHETAKSFKESLKIFFLKDRKNRPVTEVYYDSESGIYREGVREIVNKTVEYLLHDNRATTNFKNELYNRIKDLGSDDYSKWKSDCDHVVVSNGSINLEKYLRGEPALEDWSSDHHSMSFLEVAYDPADSGKEFEDHINLVIPDQTDREVFQMFIGSFLEPNNYSHQKIAILNGPEGSGKTITLRLLVKVFGDENISAKSFQQLIGDKFAMADLSSVMANICEELPQTAIKQAERLNSLTGGLVDAQRKGDDPFTFHQNAKIIAACNDLPLVIGDDNTIRALMSRILVITFGTRIRGTSREIQDYDRVMLEHRSGILNWILEGYRKYRNGGRKIASSRSTEETLELYIAKSDFVSYFIRGCTKSGDPEKDFVIKTDLYNAYLDAAKLKGMVTVTQQFFKEVFPMKFKFGPVKTDRTNVNGRQEHVFKGVILRPKNVWFSDHGEDEDSKQSEGRAGNPGKPSTPIETGEDTKEGENFTGKKLGPGQNIRICTSSSQVLNPFQKMKKGTLFRFRIRDAERYNLYDFSRDPEKGEIDVDIDLIPLLSVYSSIMESDPTTRIKAVARDWVGEFRKPRSLKEILQAWPGNIGEQPSMVKLKEVLGDLANGGFIRKVGRKYLGNF